MISRLCRFSAWLAILGLLINLVGHTLTGAALAAASAVQPGGPILVICSPDGFKRLLWTPEGFVPLPGEDSQVKPSCPYCTLAAAGAVLPESSSGDPPARLAQAALLHKPSASLFVESATPTPPVRAPPRLADRSAL